MTGTTSLQKKTGLDLNYLDTHITCEPDLCPLDTYLTRLQGIAYKQALTAWCEAFPQGVAARIGLNPVEPAKLEDLESRFGAPSLSYKTDSDRHTWIFADPEDTLIVAIDWGIFAPGITLCVKCPNFETGLRLSEAVISRRESN